jgi:Rieske Fe-S protein
VTLEDRLEQLANRTPPGDPARVLAGARARTESRPESRRPSLIAAAAAVVAVLAVAAAGFAVLNDGDDHAVTVAGPDAADTESQVALPESGALPQQLADGTPVWVVRHDDGSVSVVDAVSAHRPFGAGTLVAWCESSRGFVDPMYGSLYDEHGGKQAGPAPSGLNTYPVTRVDADTAIVAGTAVEQPRSQDGGPALLEPAGPHCFDTDSDYTSGVIEGSFESHSLASTTPVTPKDALRETDGTLVVVDAAVVVVKGRQPLVCTSEVSGSPPTCEGIPAPELYPHDETPVVMRGVFVARPDAGTLTDIAYVGERNVINADPGPDSGEAIAVPRPVLPSFVPDGYRLAWVDTPAEPPVDPERFPLHERPHDYAYGYQTDSAELEVRVLVGSTIQDPETVADEWNALAAPASAAGRTAVGYTDGDGYTRLLVEVDGGVVMVTTHPLGASFPDGPNPTMPAPDQVDRFAGSIRTVGDDEWAAALGSQGVDVASTFGPKDGTPVVNGDGWALVHGLFRAPLSVRWPSVWVDFDGTPGPAVSLGTSEDDVQHAEISIEDATRVAWGVLPAGAETVEVTVDGRRFDGVVALLDDGTPVFAVDVSGTVGNGRFQALGPAGTPIASGPIEGF